MPFVRLGAHDGESWLFLARGIPEAANGLTSTSPRATAGQVSFMRYQRPAIHVCGANMPPHVGATSVFTQSQPRTQPSAPAAANFPVMKMYSSGL
jgi:hypothetical protein